MEKVFEEILFTHSKCLKLCSKKILFLKIMYLLVNLISIVYPKHYLLVAMIFINTTLLLILKLYRTLIYVAVMWILTALLISGICIFAGTYTNRLLNILLYVYASTLALLFFVSTTPPKQFVELTGLNPFTLAYLMLRNVVEEIREIVVVSKARGWSNGLNPLNYVKIIQNIVIGMSYRIKSAEESLKSRGLD
ncbi:MAG: hypothetical protein QXO14_01940 [Desulfurococcaceae archaeon]